MTRRFQALQKPYGPQVVAVLAIWVIALGSTATFAAPLSNQEMSVADIARRNSPAVVTISTASGTGSGVVLESSGVIATALHVVRGDAKATIRLSNGDTYTDVAVVDVDERRDIVLLKIKAFGLPSATLGNSDRLQVGDRVILIGSPKGLDSTVSDGLVSAVRDSGDGYRLIQTSAAASPGSSGGGVFSHAGDLVGIVTSKLTSGENLNFAVPINYVRGMLSAEAKMSLAELAAQYPDPAVAQDLSGTTAPPTSSQTQTSSTEADRRLQAMISKAGLDMARSVDGVWSVSYRGTHLPSVTVTATADDSFILVSAVVAEAPRLTESQLRKFLRMSYLANFSKAALTERGQLVALHEVDLGSTTAEALKDIVASVAKLADDIFGTLSEAETVDRPPLTRSGRTDRTHTILNKHTIEFLASDWKETPMEQLPGVKRTQWAHTNGELWMVVAEERSQIPLDRMLDIALSSLKDLDPNAKVRTRGTRVVNGLAMTFQEVSLKADGIDVIFYGHYFSDASGTVQLTGFSAENLFAEHRAVIERFVSTFRTKQ